MTSRSAAGCSAHGTVHLLLLAIAVGVTGSVGALTLSGDVDQNGQIEITDVVRLVNTLQSGERPAFLEAVIADANQDGLFDSDDALFVADILLGREVARPVGMSPLSASIIVSFHRQGIPLDPDKGFEDQTITQTVSFWFEPSPPPAAEEHVPAHRVSLWFREAPPAPTEVNVQLPRVSLWFRADPPTPGEADTRLFPARFWRPPPVPAATEVDARQLGTPSFDRE